MPTQNSSASAVLTWVTDLPQAGAWAPEDVASRFAAIARHIRTEERLPEPSFVNAGSAWARASDTRLLDAAITAFLGSDPGEALFQSALEWAARLDRLPIFEQMAHPHLSWTTAIQAEVLRLVAKKESDRQAVWHAAFWARVPAERRPALYAWIARQNGISVVATMDDLRALHDSVPNPDPRHLAHGVVEALYHTLIRRNPDAETLALAPPAQGWDRVRVQVDPEAVLRRLMTLVGDEAKLSSRTAAAYHAACDAILVDVGQATRAAWLARTDLALPRARAMDRQDELQARPARPSPRARPRS